MKYLGTCYSGDSSWVIVNKKAPAHLGAGVFVKLDPSDPTGETVALFDGQDAPYGLTGMDKKSFIDDKNIKLVNKSIIIKGSGVMVKTTIGTPKTGELVYIQNDGTLSNTVDEHHGAYVAMSAVEKCLDWDDTEHNGFRVDMTKRIEVPSEIMRFHNKKPNKP